MIKLLQSEARTLPVILIDSTDHISPKTGIAEGATTVQISKNGGALGAFDDTGKWTELGQGLYTIDFAIGDLNTVGFFVYLVTAAGCDQYSGVVYVDDFSDYKADLSALALEATVDTVQATLQHVDFGECVYFYSGSGAGGTAYPLGTPTNPVNSMANAKTIADALNLHCIRIHGAATIPSQMEHYSFLGHRHEALTDYIDLNGQDVDGCYFEGLLVKGTQAGAGFINIKDCVVYALLNFTGMITNSAFYASTCSLEDNGYADIDSCYSIYGAVTLTVRAPTRASIKDYKGNLILTAQDGGVMLLRDFVGSLEIDAMTGGTLAIYANGADITINADCTGGTITIYGSAKITGAGGGVTINDYSVDSKVVNLPSDPADQSSLETFIIAGVANVRTAITDAHTITDGKLDSAQDDLDTLIAAALAADTDISTLIKILTNKWEITGNQLIMYDDDGTTPLYTFDLTRSGTPTQFNPDKREPA